MRVKTKDAPELAIFAKVAGSKKRSLTFTVCENVRLYGRYWSDGSRNEYVAVNIKTGKIAQAPHTWNPIRDTEDVMVAIPDGIVIVQVGTFCGKPATPHIYINPANAAKLLEPLSIPRFW